MMKGKTQFILLFLIFFLPMVLSWYLYHYHERFQFKTTNHGTLITPPIDAQFLVKSGEKKWKIIYVEEGICDAQCHQSKNDMLQVQKALGKDRDRVSVLFISRQSHEILLKNTIYLVDPIGNLFMSYPNAADPMNVLKDMKHLLEVSQIG